MTVRSTKHRRAILAIITAVIGSAFALSSCTIPIHVSGFRPIQPATSVRLTHDFPTGVVQSYEAPVVESLKPTLKWESFPGTEESGTTWALEKPPPFVDIDTAAVSNIRYDLIIWKATETLPIVYEREGLPEPSHTVETALEPDTHYAWSVRARFDLNGQTRVSEWSMIVHPAPPLLIQAMAAHYGVYGPAPLVEDKGEPRPVDLAARQTARRTGQVPLANLYRFKTPAGPDVTSVPANVPSAVPQPAPAPTPQQQALLPPSSSSPVASPAPARGRYDGEWKGRAAGRATWLCTSDPATVMLTVVHSGVSGQLKYTIGAAEFSGEVSADGSFETKGQWGRLIGNFEEDQFRGTLSMDVVPPGCSYAVSLERVKG